MALLWAYLGNDAARTACLLHPVRHLLRDESHPALWGLGYFAAGEVLLQRRPVEGSAPLDFYRAVSELRTDAAIACSGATQLGGIEQTPPFRYRSWLFSAVGDLPIDASEHAMLLARLPDPLRRNVRGASGHELIFHQAMKILGPSRIDDFQLPARELVAAVAQSLRSIGGMIGADRLEAASFAFALENGRELCVIRQRIAVTYQALAPAADCSLCREMQTGVSVDARRVEHEHLRGVIAVAGDAVPTLSHTLADHHALSVSASLAVRELPLFPK